MTRDFESGSSGAGGSGGGDSGGLGSAGNGNPATSGSGPVAGTTDAGGSAGADAGAGGEAGAPAPPACETGAKQACWESAAGVPISAHAPAEAMGNCRFGERVCTAAGTWGTCRGAVGPELADSCGVPGDDANCNGQPNDQCACVTGATRVCGTNLGSCKQGEQSCSNSVWSDCVGEVKPKTFDSCETATDDSNCNGVHDGCPCNGNEIRDCGTCGSQTCAPATRDWGECKPAKPALKCGDCGTKTCGNGGVYGGCVGGVAASCSGLTLSTCNADGSVAMQSCYACANNACKADPCAGKVCNTPKPNACASATQLVSYDTVGSCSDQAGAAVCTYASHSSSCNCQNDACTTDPCLGKTCNSPPASSCSGDTLTKYAAPGTCGGQAQCSYPTTVTVCPFGCDSGMCKPDPCAGKTCNSPPATTCTGRTQTKYAGTGTCGGQAQCSYAATDSACPSNKQCDGAGGCVVCKADESCGAGCSACSGDTSKCQDLGTTSACVGCLSNADCSAPGTACQISSNSCLKKNGQSCSAAGQCVSNVCSTFYADLDADGYGDPSTTTAVCGSAPPTGYVSDQQDCCDGDPAAFPGQTQPFDVPRKCGGFDYNCDGSSTKQLTQQSVSTCNLAMNSCDFVSEGWSAGIPACGQKNNWNVGCKYGLSPFDGKPSCSYSIKTVPSQPVQTCL